MAKQSPRKSVKVKAVKAWTCWAVWRPSMNGYYTTFDGLLPKLFSSRGNASLYAHSDEYPVKFTITPAKAMLTITPAKGRK